MNLDLSKWSLVKNVFSKAQKANMHVNIASVSIEGIPNITPIGTVFLNDDGTGFLLVVFKKLCHFLKLLKTGMMHYGNYI